MSASSYLVFRDGVQIGTSLTTTYTDSGLPAGVTHQYTIAGVNAGGTGPQSPPITASTSGAPSTSPIPWNPTLYAMSVAAPPSGSLSAYQNEINAYAASLAGNPTLFAIVGGYTFYIGWNILEPTTKGTYAFTLIGQVYAYLQSKVPGARMVVQPTCYQNWLTTFSASAGSSILPSYAYNGGTATYGTPSQGGSGAGWGLIAYQGDIGGVPGSGHYGQVIAMLNNTNLSNAYANMQIALLQYLTANCPLADAVLDYTPSEFANFQSNPTTPTSYSASGWVSNWIARATAIRAAVPGKLYGTMMEYTSTGMVGADLQNMVNSTAAVGSAFSCTDVFWSGTAIDPTDGQNYFTGAVGSTPQIGKTSSFPTVQPEDFERTGGGASSTPNTVGQVVGILSNNCYAHLKADHVCIAMASETAATTPPVPAFSLKAWYDTTKTGTAANGFIVTGILSAGGIPTANQLLPLNLMYAVQGVTTTPTTSTSITINWTGQSGITQYFVYRDGASLGNVSGTSFTDVGLNAHSTHSYQIQMGNTNGSGPKSTAVPGSTT